MSFLLSLSNTVKWEGLSLVEGFAYGQALVLKSFSEYEIEKTKTPESELEKFHKVEKLLEDDLTKALKKKISIEQKELLETSKILLQDRGWNKKIEEKIVQGFTAKTALCQITDEIMLKMNKLDDVYLRERMNDFQDLSARLLNYLDENNLKKINFDKIILVAKNLGSAQLLEYDLSKIKGIVLAEGSVTMHIAIVARAYGIPLIGGIPNIWKKIKTGDVLALNAKKAFLYKDPSDETMQELNLEEEKDKKKKILEKKDKDKPSFTKDGTKIELGINLGLADDVLLANAPPFDKVGLYRTELPFMLTKELPNCSQQICIYKKVLAHAKGKPVFFRTLDIGSDKVLPYTHLQNEENPAMGWRSTRMTLDRRAILRNQLKALICSVEGNSLYIMFPMIGEISEFIQAKETLYFELEQMRLKHEMVPKEVFVGSMMEIPSLLFYLKNYMQLFDFISIGTNDLKQFFFAADRGNRSLLNRFDNLSPAFLNFLKEISDTCRNAHIPCSVCGEMAGNPLEAMALIGLGFTSLSMNPHSLLGVKMALRKLNKKDFALYIDRLLRTETTSLRPAIVSYLRDHHVLED